jgi:positive regulator of sigma E activity
MNGQKNEKPEQIEAKDRDKSPPSENPVAKALGITVSIPETVEIRMVDASVLADYEVWFFISSILATAVVGFLVAYLESQGDTSLLTTTLVFVGLLAISCIMTFVKRHKLRKKSKDVKLRAIEIVGESESDTSR